MEADGSAIYKVGKDHDKTALQEVQTHWLIGTC